MTAGPTEVFPAKVSAHTFRQGNILENPRRACRNLFGSPEQGAVKALRETEEEIKFKNLQKRYRVLEIIPNGEKAIPIKIQQEQDAYEKKLKCNSESLKLDPKCSESTPKSHKKSCSIQANLTKKPIASASKNESSKEGGKQKHITECYIIRKRSNEISNFEQPKRWSRFHKETSAFSSLSSNISSVDETDSNTAEQKKKT